MTNQIGKHFHWNKSIDCHCTYTHTDTHPNYNSSRTFSFLFSLIHLGIAFFLKKKRKRTQLRIGYINWYMVDQIKAVKKGKFSIKSIQYTLGGHSIKKMNVYRKNIAFDHNTDWRRETNLFIVVDSIWKGDHCASTILFFHARVFYMEKLFQKVILKTLCVSL